MARKKKDGKRATGIQSKKGWLYILTTKNVVDNNGHIKNKKHWISTGLKDTSENIDKAIQMRERILANPPAIDRAKI